MSYKCSACNTIVGPRMSMQRHTVYREKEERSGDDIRYRKEIAKELPVCASCGEKLAAEEK